MLVCLLSLFLIGIAGTNSGTNSGTNRPDPWDGDRGSVVFLNEQSWETIESKTAFFSFFHSPWYQRSKSLVPHFVKASEAVKHLLIFTAVNCDVSRSLCMFLNITEFPTLLYFVNRTARPEQYRGPLTERGVVKYVKQKKGVELTEEDKLPGLWEVNGHVIHLTDGIWEQFRKDHKRMLVMFYTSWSVPSQQLQPDYAAASLELLQEEVNVPFAALDCIDFKDRCDKEGIKEYPRLLFYHDSRAQGNTYVGGKDTASLVYFVRDQWLYGIVQEDFLGVSIDKLKIKQLKKILEMKDLDCPGCSERAEYAQRVRDTIKTPIKRQSRYTPAAPKTTPKDEGKKPTVKEIKLAEAEKVAKAGWAEGNGKVQHVFSTELPTLRQQNPKLVILFYTSWCGHCKHLKPEYVQASIKLEKIIKLAAIDCETNGETCKTYNVNMYPTVLFFTDSTKVKGEAIEGRTGDAIVRIVRTKLDLLPAAAEGEWKDVAKWKNNGNVKHVDDEHWVSWRKSHPLVFVMFYENGCVTCENQKGVLVKASERLKEEVPQVAVVAVDCDANPFICSKYGVTTFPTYLFLQHETGHVHNFGGVEADKNIVSFIQRQVERIQGTKTEKTAETSGSSNPSHEDL